MEIKYTGMELKLHRHGIRTALASVFGAMLIATPLVGDSALVNGIVTGKVFWFHLSMALMAIGTVVTAWLAGGKASRLHCRTDCCSSLPGSRSRHTTGSSIPNPKNCFSAGSWSCCGFCCAIFLQSSLPEVLFLICADAHRTGRSRLGNAAIAWLCLFQPFAFPADGFFL